MDKVKFHDREVPVLLDFQRMGDAVDDAIKAVLSNFVVNTNTVFQGFNVTQNSPLGLSVKVNEGSNGISIAVKSDGDVITSIGSYSLTVIPNPSAVVKAIVIGKEAHQDSDQENRYFRDIDGSLSEQPVYTKEVLQSIEIEDVKIIHGTPGGAMPAMSSYTDYIKLAEITIPAGATEITNAMIKNVDACATWEADTATTHRKVMPSAFHMYQNNDGKYVIMYGNTTLTKLFEIDSSGNVTTIGNLAINGTLSGISTVNASTINATTGNITTVNTSTTNATTGNIATVNATTGNFSGIINAAILDANKVVTTDGYKNLSSLAYSSANTALNLVQRDSSGNFSAGTITANIIGNASGNAGTATKLATARTIGGVSFDGTKNINLPGVNITGNQNTTGSSASCTGNAATVTNGVYTNGSYSNPSWITSIQADKVTGLPVAAGLATVFTSHTVNVATNKIGRIVLKGTPNTNYTLLLSNGFNTQTIHIQVISGHWHLTTGGPQPWFENYWLEEGHCVTVYYDSDSNRWYGNTIRPH